MSTSKHLDKICIAAVAVTLVLALLMMCGESLGITCSARSLGYESRLFSAGNVHKIDIVMDGWDSFLESCENEEYSPCTAVIDGESCKNIGIRAKGNTSLSNVKSLGSQRYSFKLEFDRYESGKSYHGLDKLCLNNLIQDNTMMKDYLVYQMMGGFGVDAPLCSFVYITVNGQDWGLYLAVEGVEDSFLQRNGSTGALYKPDSSGFGGGRGNGKDFQMGDLDGEDVRQPGGMGATGSADVKLQYVDDDPDSYPNIFDNAKTDITDADEQRLIAALKKLSAYTDLESVLDMDKVLRYFVVHNFVCNGDSYTGSMIHNYYLHEEAGRLSMIPWDYNLAFGTFQGGSAASAVNASIDSPVTGGDVDDRPMVGWIFSDESYTQAYHRLFAQFITEWFESGKLMQAIHDTAELIRPYVEQDPTKFCTTEEFDTAVTALSQFVTLRSQAVSRQLDGDSTAVDTAGLNLNDMGSMGGGRPDGSGGMPGNMGGQPPEQPDGSAGFPGNTGGQPPEAGSDAPAFEGGRPGQDQPGGCGPNDGTDQAGGNFQRPGENQGQRPVENQAGEAPPNNGRTTSWLLLGASVLTLALGLLIAVKKKW